MNKGAPSRQGQILQLLLVAKKGLSIDEMASALNISRNAIKQHLMSLEYGQMVQKYELNNTGGRPAQSYILTEKGINYFPKQYSWFCNLVLSDLKSEMGEAGFKGYMAKLGRQLAQSLMQQVKEQPQTDKINTLIDIMQSLGYHARLDPTSATPVILAFNCVYHDLAQQYPELCEFDNALMSTLLEKSIVQTECMAKSGCVCKFAFSS